MGVFFEWVHERLTLWTRQLAWLTTAPEVEHTGKGKKPEPVTRIKTMEAQGTPVLFPENPAPYITDWLMEIGPTIPAGMGEAPISWEALAAWSNITGVDLDPWEARTIRSLSAAFISQRHDARLPACLAPYSGVEQPAEVKDRVSAQFKAMIGAFRKSA